MPLKQTITREQLKEQIGEENIFTHYFGDFTLQTAYNSIFRDDKKASTGFFLNKHDSIVYNDFATGEKYDFVHFVMKLYGISYYAALKHIAANFGLINSKGISCNNAIIKPVKQAKKSLKKAIIINATPFKKEHLIFWAQYGITEQELKQASIYAVNSFTINRIDEDTNKVVSSYTNEPNNEIKFAYVFTHGEETYIKIYTPYSKVYKWAGNVPLSLPFGLDSISPEKDSRLIITKSVKDCLVLRKFFPNVIGLQNESPFSITKELLEELLSTYKEVLMWFDFDRPGIHAYNYYKKNYNIKPIWTVCNNRNVWQNLTLVRTNNIKDPSDFVKRHNLDVLQKYLEYIKLI